MTPQRILRAEVIVFGPNYSLKMQPERRLYDVPFDPDRPITKALVIDELDKQIDAGLEWGLLRYWIVPGMPDQ